jgi:hypothetical protein
LLAARARAQARDYEHRAAACRRAGRHRAEANACR